MGGGVSGSRKIRTSPFELRVRLLLVLLAMVLAAANVGNFLLLRSAREALRSGEGRLASEVSRRVLREAGESSLASSLTRLDAVAVRYPPTTLRSLAARQGLLGLELISPEGTVLSSSSPERLGAIDSDLASAGGGPAGAHVESERWLGPVEREGESAIVDYRTLRTDKGAVAGYFKTVLASPALGRVESAYRIFAAAQAIGLLLAAVAALALSRWIARPYRLLAQAVVGAKEQVRLDPGEAADDPDALVSLLRGVLEKIRRQEEELRRLATAGAAAEGPEGPEPSGAAPVDPVGGFARTIAPTMVSGVIAVDRKGNVVALNPAGEKMLGVSLEGQHEQGRPARELLACSEELLRLVEATLESGQPRSREVVAYRRPGGGMGHLGAALSPIAAQGAWRGGVLCLVSELSEIGSLRERARLRESLAAVGQISAGIAHEFRNSLATILGYARLIERAGAGGPAAGHAGAIAREVESVRSAVDQFLKFARPGRLSRGRVDLAKLCAQAAEEVEMDWTLPRLRIELEGELPEIQADETLLRQAFANLFRNAAESAPGRPVALRVRGRIDTQRESVRIELSDDGAGISEENLGRIFLPFFTTKDKGAGLGLAIAQKAIVDHDGAIDVSSRRGEGTTFNIVLPLSSP